MYCAESASRILNDFQKLLNGQFPSIDGLKCLYNYINCKATIVIFRDENEYIADKLTAEHTIEEYIRILEDQSGIYVELIEKTSVRAWEINGERRILLAA